MTEFKVVVFAQTADIFSRHLSRLKENGLQTDQVVWGDSSRFSRLELINGQLKQALFFIDHDCFPDAEQLKFAQHCAAQKKYQGGFVIAGRYLNPPQASWFQRAHNLIANCWLEHSYLNDAKGYLLGGVFLVRADSPIQCSADELFWGAEDKVLAIRLQEAGLDFFYRPELAVRHHTSNSLAHFMRRAWLHGKNDMKYVNRPSDKINFLFWLRKVGFVNFDLAPSILLHFCIQRAASLFQKFRP